MSSYWSRLWVEYVGRPASSRDLSISASPVEGHKQVLPHLAFLTCILGLNSGPHLARKAMAIYLQALLFFFWFCWNRISCDPGCPYSWYGTKNGLELLILLPLPLIDSNSVGSHSLGKLTQLSSHFRPQGKDFCQEPWQQQRWEAHEKINHSIGPNRRVCTEQRLS